MFLSSEEYSEKRPTAASAVRLGLSAGAHCGARFSKEIGCAVELEFQINSRV